MRNTYFESEPEDQRYTFAVGLVRSFENKLLDQGKIERLVEAVSSEEILRLLQDTPYGSFISTGKDRGEFEEILMGRKKEVFDFFDEFCIDSCARTFLHAPYDFSNLKLVLKSQLLEKDYKSLFSPLGELQIEVFTESTSDGDFISEKPSMDEFSSDLTEFTENQSMPDYLLRASEKALREYYRNKDPRMLDMSIDEDQYRYLSDIVEKMKSPYLKALLQLKADGINLSTFLRVKQILKKSTDTTEIEKMAFIDGGSIDRHILRDFLKKPEDEIKSFLNSVELYEFSSALDKGSEEIEKIKDKLYVYLLRQAKFFTSGVEPLIAFVLAVDHEVKTLRRILISRNNEIPKTKLRNRLVEVV